MAKKSASKKAAKKAVKKAVKAPKAAKKASKAKGGKAAGKKAAPKPVKPVDPMKLRKQVLAAFTEVGYAALKANGKFVVPGWAKFGINPFTKEPCIVKARPASKTVKARAIKAVKNVV
eukprot:gene7528-25_t